MLPLVAIGAALLIVSSDPSNAWAPPGSAIDAALGGSNPLDRGEMLRLGPVKGRVIVSDDRAYLAFIGPDGRIHAARCAGDVPGEIPLLDLPPASAVAFEPASSRLYFAHDGRWLGQVDLARADERVKWTVQVADTGDEPITGLCVSAHQRIAWSTAGGAGLIDALSGESLATWTDVGSPVLSVPETCRARFDPSGAFLVVPRTLPTGILMLCVIDAKTGEDRVAHQMYVSGEEPGFAFVAEGVAFGWRDQTARDPAFRVLHLALPSLLVREIDPDAAGAHFISLLASADGSHLVRSDLGVPQLTVWSAERGLTPHPTPPLRLCDTFGWDDTGTLLWQQRRRIATPEEPAASAGPRAEGVFALDPVTGFNLGELTGIRAPNMSHVIRITGGERTPLIVEWASITGETFVSVLWRKPSR